MADLPISGLPTVTVPNKAYTVAAVSASVTSQMTLSQVAAAISSSFTASQAVSASYATSASYEINYETSSSYADTASFVTSSNVYGPFGSNSILTSSYSTTASYWLGSSNYTPTAYLSAFHTASLTVPTADTPCTMSYSTTDFSYGGITISGSYADKIKFATGGIYNIQFSAQTSKTTGTSSNIYIWLAKNGVEQSNSNTGVTLAGGANDVAIPAWNLFVSASAGDYYQLMFAADNTNTLIKYIASGSAGLVGPAVPSVILTVNRIA